MRSTCFIENTKFDVHVFTGVKEWHEGTFNYPLCEYQLGATIDDTMRTFLVVAKHVELN